MNPLPLDLECLNIGRSKFQTFFHGATLMIYRTLVLASAFYLGALTTVAPTYANALRGNQMLVQKSVLVGHAANSIRKFQVETERMPENFELRDLFEKKDFQDLVANAGPCKIVLVKEGEVAEAQYVAFDGGVITFPAAGAVASAALVVLVFVAVVVTVVIIASEWSEIVNQAHEWIEVLTESKVRQEAEIDIIVQDKFDGWVQEKEAREENIRELTRVIQELWQTIDDYLPGGDANPN